MKKFFLQCLIKYDQAVGIITRVSAIIASILMALITIAVTYEIVLRGIFNSPTIWSVELTSYAIVWVCFLGTPWVLRQNNHLKIDFVLKRISGVMLTGLENFTDLLSLSFCIFLSYQGIKFIQLSYIIEATSASELRIQMWIPQLIIPIGFALLLLEFSCRLFRRWFSLPEPNILEIH